MGKVLREATLYRETGKTNRAGARILTRGKTTKKPQADLRKKSIDVLVGHFWVANLPDLTRWNEAYVEIDVVTIKGKVKVPHSFKLQVDVSDTSFSAGIQGAEVITGAEVIGNGVEFQCRLTELDKIDKDKFQKIKNFVDNNDIPGVAQALLNASGLPFNPKEAIKILFNAVDLLDALNEDDRVWSERPKLDLRRGTNNPLYEGWYALVSTPNRKKDKLPIRLLESGGYLFTSYNSDEDNVRFEHETYLTWQVLAS